MPKQLVKAKTKLETVERQLETAKAEVNKPFAQESELAEKLERLSALNALLNMDEKGDNALGMDDSTEIDDVREEEKDGQDTSGHHVQKSWQKAHDIDKPETVETAADTPIPYPVENARHNCAVGNGNSQGLKIVAAMADKPTQRTSLKAKLEAFKRKAAGGDIEKTMPKKSKKKLYNHSGKNSQSAVLSRQYQGRSSVIRIKKFM